MMISLEDVAQLTAGTLLVSGGQLLEQLTGVEIDSRRILPGQLFVAYRGEHLDGHDYAGAAVAAGATALLVEHPVEGLPHPVPQVVVPQPRAALIRLANRALLRSQIDTVIGITGSAGKTTTRHIISMILSAAYPSQVLEPPASYNTDTGLSMTILNHLQPEHRFAVFEMAAQRIGEIASLCELAPPTIGLVTNVGPAHLEFFGSLANVAQAKGELIEALSASGLAVLNAEDAAVRAMVYRSPAPAAFYGFGEAADYRGRIVREDNLGMEIAWTTPTASGDAYVHLLGEHNLLNVLGALAVAERCDVPTAVARHALGSLRPVASRLQVLAGPRGTTIIDDCYNANRLSAIAGLQVLATRAKPGHRIAVLGDMFELGQYGPEEHHAVGMAAAASVDYLFTIGTLAAHIAQGAIQAGMSSARVCHISAPADQAFRRQPQPQDQVALSRQTLTEALLERLSSGDVVLFKAGRGMRLDYVIDLLRQNL
ncbi:MAG: UDP-N-acetylmuramoyl-tripeptide--D-alanyl-D-alanine ligase [Chloroflexi bacterium]|nr:UDP-N-acetylmuramoyl-tripeptide--D-alanyl-D-alanine ligase [Chloroflexota bacterium]